MYSSQVSIALSGIPFLRWKGEASLGRLLVGGVGLCLHHHFDGVFHPILGVTNRRRKVIERKCVRMNLRGVEPLLPHEGLGAMRRALAFTADAVDVDVVAHDMRNID